MEGLDMMDPQRFQGKRVLVTGHTGFKGAWLAIWLESMGAHVIGVALDPEHPDGVYMRSDIGARLSDNRLDIRDADGLIALLDAERPEIVFHLAAQALVLESYRSPMETFSVNTQGTVHVLEAIRRTSSVRAAVLVTTDKCYENREWPHGYRETDALGGHDPYSASKGAAEIAITSYRRSFFSAAGAPGIASARAGNVIGGGDWAADRIVPDLMRSIEQGQPLLVRHPRAVRPWQHVLEPLWGYLLLADRLLEDPIRYSGAWNFGPAPTQTFPVQRLTEALLAHLGKGAWLDGSSPGQAHEAGLLMLDISKAVSLLGWSPRLTFADMVRLTADWYGRHRKEDVLGLCCEQINTYVSLADHKGQV